LSAWNLLGSWGSYWVSYNKQKKSPLFWSRSVIVNSRFRIG
jgi:hypothetical protein